MLTLSGIFAFSTVAYANADLRDRQRQITQDLTALTGEITALTTQLSSQAQEIVELEGVLDEIYEEIRVLETELENTAEALEIAENDLHLAEIARGEQIELLIQRIRAMYMSGPSGYIEALFSANSLSELMTRVDFINRIVEHDQNLVTEFLELEDLIADRIEEISIHEVALLALESQARAKQSDYEGQLAQREERMRTLQAEERELLNQRYALNRADREVRTLIAQAEAALRPQANARGSVGNVDVASFNGRFRWPVPGHSRISSAYGNRRSPISGRNEMHSGIDIPAPTGTNIIAVYPGVVIFNGWMNGYGNTIIIDHGEGLSTLYAHNSRNISPVGTRVETGTVIAHIGSTGFSTGPHLHFEVRVNGRHVAPMPFLQ